MMETLTANGVDLSTLASNVEELAGLLRSPKRRGDNLAVPGRHGLLRVPNKLYDAAELVLPMWVVGEDPDTLRQRIDDLARLFGSDTVTLEHTYPDGSVRRAVCEVSDVIEFPRDGLTPIGGRFSVALVNPNSFWTDTTTTSASFTVATGTHRVLTEFAAGTAPTDELVVTFTGPVNNPELSQPSSGVYLAYDGVIAAGRKIVISTTGWDLNPGDGTPWTPTYANFRHGGARGRWFQLMPQPGGPDVIFVHTGGGTATCTIAGPRKYLNG